MSIKEKIKKIPFVMPVWHGISHCKAIYNQSKPESYIKKVIRNSRNDSSKKNRKIKVGFIVQVPTVWDKSEDVFLEMLKRENIEVKLLVVPKNSWTDYSKFDSYNGNFFLEKYPEYSIKIMNDDGSVIDVAALNFDYVFYPRPYDIHLPKKIRSTELVKFTKCCNIPYGYSCSDNFYESTVNNRFFVNIYFEFLESEYERTHFYRKYRKACNKGIRRFEYLGYPCLAEYLNIKPRDEIRTITWTPRWSYDQKVGGSNFVEYKDDFIELCRKLPKEIKVIFRPHPLMFDELVAKQIITETEKEDYIKKLNDLSVHMDLENPINDVLKDTDILITDLSSIIIQFFITNRPIIYCKKNIEFNEDVKEIEKYMYLANSWKDVDSYLSALISRNDNLSEGRAKFIEKKFSYNKDSAKRIVDRIISDYADN